jgi:NAD(P)-dependent dehydrogenase (short-subunit alcohol dehydrogenase family)
MYKKIFNFESKIIVVCGAGGLIGKELVKCYAELGARVVSLDINPCEESSNVTALVCDINSENSVRETVKKIIKDFGRIDSWVNCAYPRTKDWGKTLEEADLNWFNENTQLHLGGYFNVSKIVLEQMKIQKSGSLINYSSIYGIVGPNFSIYEDLPMTNPVAYSAIKAGIINLSKYFATYYGPHGVRVNCISPGGVADGQNATFVERYNKLTPLGRMSTKEEIAASTVFLSSDAASFITGHNLVVDGGWTAH